MRARAPSVALAMALALLGASNAHAAGLDVEAWLRRPGVRLVVVEFYATWCKPCMEAVPRWKALHERYRGEGLRLVVVATQDPKAGCSSPGWSPDEVICDDEGQLAARFGADNLPAAFLWSWQGNLLVSKGHVEEVERAIEAWMREAPRVDVAAGDVAPGSGIDPKGLAQLVRARLRDEDKLHVVATEAERRRLDAVKKRSLEARYDERMQCEIGKDLSANSVLEAHVHGAARKRLSMNLLSAERGCLVASSVVDWAPAKAGVSVGEGLAELMQKIRGEVRYPWMAAPGAQKSKEPSYAALARELEAAKAEEARAAERREARRAEIERAWRVVAEFAAAEGIERSRRVSALERFLGDFPDDNPREGEAKALLTRLRPPPAPVPLAPVVNPPRPAVVKDSDGDGIPDHLDQCPFEPEDKDGFQDDDGCPDPDNDGDGILDIHDKCPNEPGPVEEGGCPRRSTLPISKSGGVERLAILEKITFRVGRAELDDKGKAVADGVAAMLKSEPKLGLRIEVHTDSVGSDTANLALSQARAKAVLEHLLAAGVARSRLEAEGYGEQQPIASNKTAEGRANNRRVELIVLRR